MRHRGLVAAIIGLSAIGAAVEATDVGERLLAVRRVGTLLASVPGLSVGGVSLRDRTLAIEGVDFRAPSGARIEVGHLALSDLAPGPIGLVAPASAAPVGIVATDVSVTLRSVAITIPRIEAQGTYLTADRLEALLDPAAGLSPDDRLRDLTAASLTAPSVTVTGKGSGDGRTTFEDVAMTDVVAGRIGTISIRGTTLLDTSGSAAKTVATLGPVSLLGLDLPLVLRIAETSRLDRAEAPQPIYGSLSARDVVIAPDATGTMKIAAISADGFRGRPLLRRPADIVALIDKPNGTQAPGDAQALADVALDAAKGFSLDHLEWDGVSLATNDQAAVRFGLGRMVIDGLSPTQIATWVVDDLDFATKDATVRMARMALHTPDESESLGVLFHGFAASGTAMDRTTLMGGVPRDGSLSMIGLHVEAHDASGSGNGANGGSNVFDVPLVGFASVTDRATGVATATAHAEATYALPTASRNPGLAALVRSGFKGLDARADYRMTFDPKSRAFRVDPLTVEAEKLGRVSVSADLGNVPFDLLARGRPSSDAEAALQQVTFKGFTLDVRNDGVVELALPLLAASTDKSVPLLKAAAKTQSDLAIGQALGASPAAERLEAAIDAFIDDPKTLHVAVTSPQGLTGAELQASPDPKSLLDRVGIEAVANR